MNPKREELKRWFLSDPSRMIARNGDLFKCEGQLFREHRCNFGLDLNEVIYTRQHIRTLTEKEQEYFWEKENCALNCGYFHMRYGHTREYREHHLERVVNLYSQEKVIEFILGAPLQIKAIMPDGVYN